MRRRRIAKKVATVGLAAALAGGAPGAHAKFTQAEAGHAKKTRVRQEPPIPSKKRALEVGRKHIMAKRLGIIAGKERVRLIVNRSYRKGITKGAFIRALNYEFDFFIRKKAMTAWLMNDFPINDHMAMREIELHVPPTMSHSEEALDAAYEKVRKKLDRMFNPFRPKRKVPKKRKRERERQEDEGRRMLAKRGKR